MWCGSLYIEILIALADGKGGVRSQQFMPQDLGQEDIVGHVLGFEAVAADCAVAAEVARFPGKVALAEGELDLVVKSVLGGDMGALGIGIGTDFGAEALKSGQNTLWRGQATEQASSDAPVRDVRWFNPTSYWNAQRVNQKVALTSFDTLVRIKAAYAAALGGFYRLSVHDHHAWARCTPGCNTRLLGRAHGPLGPKHQRGPRTGSNGRRSPMGKLARQQVRHWQLVRSR
jgi:hypothetical protein